MKIPLAAPRKPSVGVPSIGGRGRRAFLHRPPKGGTQTSRAAFSLIEVVIAVAIFAASASVLMSAFVSALLARDRGVSNDLLNADIQTVRMQLLLEPNLDDAEDGDEYQTLHSGEASWEASIESTEVVDLFQVQLSIRFSDPPEGLPGDYVESLYLLRPTWSESDERSELLQDKREALEDTRRGFNF